MKLTLRIMIGTVLCFAFSYLSAAIGRLGSMQAIAARYAVNGGQAIHVEIERKFPAQDVSEIDVATVSSNIHFYATDADEIKITLVGDYPVEKGKQDDVLKSQVQSGKLELTADHRQDEGYQNFGIHMDSQSEGNMTVYFPKHLKKISVKTVSGDVALNELTLSEVEVKSVSGDLKAIKTNAETFKHKTTSGHVLWDGHLGQVESKSVSGDMDLKLENLDPQVEVKTVSGDIKIQFSQKPDLKAQLSSTSGELQIDTQFGENAHAKNFKLGNGKGMVSAETVSGDLKILKK